MTPPIGPCSDSAYHAGESETWDVDPVHFTKYDRTYRELEAMLLFSLIVAGKRADFARSKLLALLPASLISCPFGYLRDLLLDHQLAATLTIARTGNYRKMFSAIRYLVGGRSPHDRPNLKTCSVADLRAIPGCGPKTARMFLLHSRPNQRLAVLDVHVLKFLSETPRKMLREHNIAAVPRATPSSEKTYAALERLFLAYADGLDITPAELDLAIWNDSTVSFR